MLLQGAAMLHSHRQPSSVRATTMGSQRVLVVTAARMMRSAEGNSALARVPCPCHRHHSCPAPSTAAAQLPTATLRRGKTRRPARGCSGCGACGTPAGAPAWTGRTQFPGTGLGDCERC
eukprot:TRINITY_DN10127_c0_g3_i1.p1 TRINITY_DN10127_c0_g3~~TRINITY_DN10127_c0_g3_i1.p1  ORF type:complete len:137 (-),score=13.96 TRINITY_DN10127_c0_g3_i1:95-451(-)